MKLTLTGALHARPASLCPRGLEFRGGRSSKGERRADAKNILKCSRSRDLWRCDRNRRYRLDAEAAVSALAVLVTNFDADLVPETGAAAAAGIAIGPAVVLAADDSHLHPLPGESSIAEGEHRSANALSVAPARARLEQAFSEVRRDLEALVRALPAAEAALFEPEIAIVAALEPRVTARVLDGARFEEAPPRRRSAP